MRSRREQHSECRVGALLAVAAAVMLAVESLTGCASTLDRQEDLEQLESKLASQASAEDYLAAALLYQRQAQRLEIQATRYEQEAAAITTLEDPKEFRRSGLMVVAQLRRKQAADLRQRAFDHRQKAEKMLGSQKPRE